VIERTIIKITTIEKPSNIVTVASLNDCQEYIYLVTRKRYFLALQLSVRGVSKTSSIE